MTSHHFFHMPVIRSKALDPAHVQEEVLHGISIPDGGLQAVMRETTFYSRVVHGDTISHESSVP